jgi:hypothetical protein
MSTNGRTYSRLRCSQHRRRETRNREDTDQLWCGCELSKYHRLDSVAHGSTIWAHRCRAVATRQWRRRERHAAELPNPVAPRISKRTPRSCTAATRTGSKCTSPECVRQDTISRSIKQRISGDCAVVVRVWRVGSGLRITVIPPCGFL